MKICSTQDKKYNVSYIQSTYKKLRIPQLLLIHCSGYPAPGQLLFHSAFGSSYQAIFFVFPDFPVIDTAILFDKAASVFIL